MFVLDTSVAMSWCFEDEASPGTDAVLDRLQDDSAVVPALWPVEVANVLLGAERRNRLTEAQSSRFLAILTDLPIEVDDGPVDVSAIVAAGRLHSLTSYDATYLVLAERLGVPLATLDRALGEAAGAAGVTLLVGAG